MIKRQSIVLLALLIVLSAVLCTGCTAGKQVQVKIQDMLTETVLSVRSGSTVRQAIEEAEIYLGEKDEVSPSADTVISVDTDITISRYAEVDVIYNGTAKKVSLTGATVEEALNAVGVKPGKNYAVNYDSSAYLTNGMKITVTKLINVELTVDGKTKNIRTEACSVKDFLQSQDIELGENDIVTPKLKTKMTSDTKVTVKRVTTEEKTETETIKYETVYKMSSSMNEGTSKVTQQGENGEKKVTYKLTYIDGKLTEKEVLKEAIIKEPVDRIITQGSKKTTQGTSQKTTQSGGKSIVSKQRVDDCNGSGHGYFVITWSDGSVTYQEY